MKGFIDAAEVAVVGFFADPSADAMATFLKAAAEIEGIPMGECVSEIDWP